MAFWLSEKQVVSSLVNIDSQKIETCLSRFQFFLDHYAASSHMLLGSSSRLHCVGSGSLQATTGKKKRSRCLRRWKDGQTISIDQMILPFPRTFDVESEDELRGNDWRDDSPIITGGFPIRARWSVDFATPSRTTIPIRLLHQEWLRSMISSWAQDWKFSCSHCQVKVNLLMLVNSLSAVFEMVGKKSLHPESLRF